MANQHDPQQSGVHGGDVATFGAALLAALGLNQAACWLRDRRVKKHQDQQHQQQAARSAEIDKLQEAGYESSDAPFGPVMLIGAGGVVTVVLVGVALWALFNFFTATPVPPRGPITQLNAPVQVPPQPRLQADPQSDWLSVRATQTALLNSYGVDPTSGAIHIPIDRAIDIVATRGLTATNSITTTGGTP